MLTTGEVDNASEKKEPSVEIIESPKSGCCDWTPLPNWTALSPCASKCRDMTMRLELDKRFCDGDEPFFDIHAGACGRLSRVLFRGVGVMCPNFALAKEGILVIIFC